MAAAARRGRREEVGGTPVEVSAGRGKGLRGGSGLASVRGRGFHGGKPRGAAPCMERLSRIGGAVGSCAAGSGSAWLGIGWRVPRHSAGQPAGPASRAALRAAA